MARRESLARMRLTVAENLWRRLFAFMLQKVVALPAPTE